MQRTKLMMGLILTVMLIFFNRSLAQTTVPVAILVDLDASTSGIRIEGLVADRAGNVYTSDLETRRFFRIAVNGGAVQQLTTLPRPASGMAFDQSGNLYLASGDRILRIAVESVSGGPFDTGAVQTFATGTVGANGLAFDNAGRLYVSGATTGNIYVVGTDGLTRTLVSGLASDRPEQRISTNGLAFGPDGRLYSANTGSGAIDRFTINPDGTAAPGERFVTNALLIGADGIAFAENGDLYVSSNERNAIVRVTLAGEVADVASNPNAGPLEFPASPAFVGNALYVSNFDQPRGVNNPAEPGIGASIARLDIGVAGAPLPYAPLLPLPGSTLTVVPTSNSTLPTAEISVSTVPVTRTIELPTSMATPAVITGTAIITGTPTLTTTLTPFPTNTGLFPTITGTLTSDLTPIPTPTTLPARLPDTGSAPSLPVLTLLLLFLATLGGLSGLILRRIKHAPRP